MIKPSAAYVVVMVATGLFATGCSRHSDSRNRQAGMPDAPLEGRPTTGVPIPIEGTENILIPFAISHETIINDGSARAPFVYYTSPESVSLPVYDWRDSGFPAFHHGYRDYRQLQEVGYQPDRLFVEAATSWNNIAISDRDGSSPPLVLFDRRGLIVSVQMDGSRRQAGETAYACVDLLTFHVVHDDTNEGGFLTAEDQQLLYIVDPHTSRTVTIQPEPGEKLEVRWTPLYPRDDQFGAIVAPDRWWGDKDGPSYLLRWPEDSEPRPIEDPELTERVRGIVQ